MKLHSQALATLLAAAAAAPAHAIVSTSTSGLTTTYFENFDSGSSFSAGWFNALASGDDYLWLTDFVPTASYTFSSATAIASLGLSFWYSATDASSGAMTLVTLTPLGDTPGNAGQFAINNPGAATAGLGNAFDAFFVNTPLTNLAAGNYTLTFSQLGGLTNALKIDDVTLTVTAVPEPETYALMLGGLGVVGWVARRRRPGRG